MPLHDYCYILACGCPCETCVSPSPGHKFEFIPSAWGYNSKGEETELKIVETHSYIVSNYKDDIEGGPGLFLHVTAKTPKDKRYVFQVIISKAEAEKAMKLLK